jgi:hypothetical protein
MASLRSALLIAILLSIRHISLRSCQSSRSVHESSIAVQKAAYLDNHLLCRIVVHSCRMQLLTAQFSPIVNTEPEEDTTDVSKRDLPGTIGDPPFGACKEHPAPSEFERCLIEHCPSVPHDCNPRRYNVLERSLGGLLKLVDEQKCSPSTGFPI